MDLQPPGSLSLSAPVWGIDPSTKRISVACVQDGLRWVETLSLTRMRDLRWRWYVWQDEIVPWLKKLRLSKDGMNPSHVFVEEPFANTEHRQKPTSYYLMGVLWAALGETFTPASGVLFDEIGPGTWKKQAMGEGQGAATPERYMAWARDVAGYAGSIEDEAAAVGVATAGGVIVAGG